jgi:ketosteroid isomerase-like protein
MTRLRGRLGSAAAVIAAAFIGFQLGGWNAVVAGAEKDPAKVLMETDRKFDEATSLNGLDAWLSYFAEDGIMLPAASGIVVGREAMRKFLAPRFEAPGFTLRWAPIDAYASSDLGYTYGVSKTSRADEDGKLVASYGKYVTIWKKQRSGAWRVALDIGNASPAPEPKK